MFSDNLCRLRGDPDGTAAGPAGVCTHGKPEPDYPYSQCIMAESGSSGWQNWSGTFSVSPARVVRPRTPEQVADEVRRAVADNLSVKAVGAGHSFTDIALTRGVMIELSLLTGIISADRGTGLVTVAAGTTLQ